MFRPHKKQMDFDLALFLMLNALKAPNKLYLHTKRLKQIRNHWHRDDPCLTAVIIGLLFVFGLLYGLVIPPYRSNEVSKDGVAIVAERSYMVISCLKTAFQFVFIQFLLTGVILSALCKWVAERFMIKAEKKQAKGAGDTGGPTSKTVATVTGNKVEPMFAFDIHCNSFFPVLVFSYGVQVSIFIG